MSQDKIEKSGVSRRTFLTGAGITAGIAALSAMGCNSPSTQKQGDAQPTEADRNAAVDGGYFTKDGIYIPGFLAKAPKPITDFADEKTYDVVVVGAGAAGLPAALSALEAGATVGVLQKGSAAISQGNTGSGIDYETSDPEAVAALGHKMIAASQHRANPKIVDVWLKNSGEAIKWVINHTKNGGAQVVDQGNGPQTPAVKEINGGKINWVTSYFGPKPYHTGDGMIVLAQVAEKAGVEIFYKTPGVQLIKDGDRVVGVVGKDKDGNHIKFNATKGVILACGDYQNNLEMSDFYQPDLHYFERKQLDKNGEGHMMGIWAGAVMEPLAHTKMLHDFDAGPASMCDMPFLVVNDDGERIVNEETPMSLMNDYTRYPNEKAGWYSQIFDSNYMTQAADWPGKLVDPEGLKTYMPEETDNPHEGVFKDLIRTFKADTLEELAGKLNIPADAFVKTVKRYNELVAQGKDVDFGKNARFLQPIDTPPFYGIHRHIRLSAICSGLIVDENGACLDGIDGEPIPGLFAVGNQAGGFYGGIDYPLDVFGMSLGRCYTAGYITGRHVAKL